MIGGRLGPVSSGPLTFRLEGEPYTLVIPGDGLEVCGWAATGNWYAVLPGCLAAGDDTERFHALLGDPRGPVGLRACWRVVHGLARPVYGYDWWVAQRLAATADAHWSAFAAWSVTVGFDPASAPAHRVCAAVWSWLMGSCKDEKEGRKMQAQIEAPPRGRPRRGRVAPPGFTPAEQAATWQQAVAQLGAGS